MKAWEEKLLGFSGAWWFLLQPLVKVPLPEMRFWLGLMALLLGALAALAVPPSLESSTRGRIANGFLLGLASMFALAGVIIAVAAVMGFALAVLG